jgi:hypothetical protein
MAAGGLLWRIGTAFENENSTLVEVQTVGYDLLRKCDGVWFSTFLKVAVI